MNASFNVRKWRKNSKSLRSLIYNCEKSLDSENFTTAEKDFNDPVQSFYLHGLSNLQFLAYGACVYLKAVTKSSNIYVLLVDSQSKLVPATKKVTIPKSELRKNIILSNLINIVYNALSEEIVVANHFCWSDSSRALAWIKNTNKEYKFLFKIKLFQFLKVLV